MGSQQTIEEIRKIHDRIDNTINDETRATVDMNAVAEAVVFLSDMVLKLAQLVDECTTEIVEAPNASCET